MERKPVARNTLMGSSVNETTLPLTCLRNSDSRGNLSPSTPILEINQESHQLGCFVANANGEDAAGFHSVASECTQTTWMACCIAYHASAAVQQSFNGGDLGISIKANFSRSLCGLKRLGQNLAG
jgi:hypothetical protein